MSEQTTGALPKLITTKELQNYLRVSRPTAEKFGKKCGARRRVGWKNLYDLATIDAAIRQTQREKDA